MKIGAIVRYVGVIVGALCMGDSVCTHPEKMNVLCADNALFIMRWKQIQALRTVVEKSAKLTPSQRTSMEAAIAGIEGTAYGLTTAIPFTPKGNVIRVPREIIEAHYLLTPEGTLIRDQQKIAEKQYAFIEWISKVAVEDFVAGKAFVSDRFNINDLRRKRRFYEGALQNIYTGQVRASKFPDEGMTLEEKVALFAAEDRELCKRMCDLASSIRALDTESVFSSDFSLSSPFVIASEADIQQRSWVRSGIVVLLALIMLDGCIATIPACVKWLRGARPDCETLSAKKSLRVPKAKRGPLSIVLKKALGSTYTAAAVRTVAAGGRKFGNGVKRLFSRKANDTTGAPTAASAV